MMWNLFDPNADSRVTARTLPHIDMPGVLTFVTFRLADSMPRSVVEEWHDEVECWLRDHKLQDHTVEEVLSAMDVSDQLKKQLRTFRQRKWHGHLDDCHGACVLRNQTVRGFIERSLLHFDGQRYDLERFVVMPNHVHAMIQMRLGFELRSELTKILRYSARDINKHLGRRGDCWQAEPFDHIVRSEAQFEYLQKYIADNPAKAHVPDGDYTLWVRP